MKRISTAFATSFRTRLLAFYDAQHRKLPWRASNDPYRVLVSEFMLQQTRVETVIPYFQRWLARFPDVDALADAQPNEVLKHWEGLGYYSRARNLQRAAQMVREQHNGAVPSNYAELKALPGVGDYTAAAVASISYAAPHAAVDGNVKRVLSRLLDLELPSLPQLQKHASTLLDRRRPGDFNQAMMELGATICTPRAPACTICPVKRLCRARRNNTVALRPAAKPKTALPHEQTNTLVAVHDGQTLVVQRPEIGLLAGLWEFPSVDNVAGCAHIGDVMHTFTHKRITYKVYVTGGRARAPAPALARARWIPFSQLNQLAMPTAQRRVAKLALPFFGL
ncbi:MAG TPA: A/G-specific adenine glycosylase [Longimicrobiales bacterium]|nr:A/G-specific adenine glycosylase [Longimicrobiales bacterium]